MIKKNLLVIESDVLYGGWNTILRDALHLHSGTRTVVDDDYPDEDDYSDTNSCISIYELEFTTDVVIFMSEGSCEPSDYLAWTANLKQALALNGINVIRFISPWDAIVPGDFGLRLNANDAMKRVVLGRDQSVTDNRLGDGWTENGIAVSERFEDRRLNPNKYNRELSLFCWRGCLLASLMREPAILREYEGFIIVSSGLQLSRLLMGQVDSNNFQAFDENGNIVDPNLLEPGSDGSFGYQGVATVTAHIGRSLLVGVLAGEYYIDGQFCSGKGFDIFLPKASTLITHMIADRATAEVTITSAVISQSSRLSNLPETMGRGI